MSVFEKTTFLFGAGAEGCFELPLGSKFTYECLINENKPLAEAIRDYCKSKDATGNYKDWLGTINANSSTKSMFQDIIARTIRSYIRDNKDLVDFKNLDDNLFQMIWYSLSDESKKTLKEKYESEKAISQKIEKYDNYKVKNNYFNDLYDNYNKYITNNENSISPKFRFENKLNKWENNLISYDSVENYFYTVLNPNKYGFVNFTRLINYYWKAYFSIVEILLSDLFEYPQTGTVKENNKKMTLNYLDYISKISSRKNPDLINEKIIELLQNQPENCYYKYLKNNNPRGIITTNYTSFVESIFDCIICSILDSVPL
jgi:hypothetical protein